MNAITYSPFGSDYDCVMDGWEAKENDDGVIYFSNSHLKSTSWTHPYLDKIFEELTEYNVMRYAAYRTALKLRHLQLKSGLSWITLHGIKKVFASRREPEDSYRESTILHKEAFHVIISILEASDNLCLHRADFAKAADIIVNLLIELYDTNYEGKLTISSLKISLTALCSAHLSEKYRYFYSEIYDYNEQVIQRGRLLYLLYDLMQIAEVLKESTAFGTNVSIAVDSCLNHRLAPTDSGRSSEDRFYSWLLLEPQIIVWLPTLHRVAATENVCHEVQCSSCGINPLKGFRYRCLQCFKYDLCQKCFYQGNVSLTHKLKHPMQEYCFPATKKDTTKAMFKILRNKLSKKHRSQSKITYLPLDDDSITGSVFQWQPRHRRPNPQDIVCGSNDSGLESNSENCAGSTADVSCCMERTEVKDSTKCTDGEKKDIVQLSKRDMIDQQCFMAKKIEELQEENRYLHEQLELMAKNKSSEDGKIQPDHNQEEKTHATETESDADLSPVMISAIECESEVERHIPTNKKSNGQDGSSSSSDQSSPLNVLDLVGHYTPVRPSFHESEHEPNQWQVMGNVDPFTGEDNKNMPDNVEESVDHVAPVSVENDNEISGDKKNCDPGIIANIGRDDLTSESTVSGGLEYGYSDMSLHSETLTKGNALKGKDTALYPGITPGSSEKSSVSKSHFGDISDKKPSIDNVEQLLDTKELHLNPAQVVEPMTLSQTTEMDTRELFFNISDILPEGSALPYHCDTSEKPITPGNDQVSERRLTLEPVFMSTPLVASGQLSGTIDNIGKENRAPGCKKEPPLQLIALYKCMGQSGVTPKSVILSKQQKTNLLENVSTDSRSVDFSHRDIGLTTMFDKMERFGAFETASVGESLTYEDKEEMEKLVQKLNTASDSSPEYHQLKFNQNDSSILNAVLNVGDAMADLVQATAEMQQE